MKPKIEICICGNNNVHTKECMSYNRNRRSVLKQKIKRIERRKKGLCIVPGCSCKGEKEIVIHQYCKKHRKKFKHEN